LSRIGRQTITVPKGVEVKIEGKKVSVKGPKGSLSRTLPPEVNVANENGVLRFTVETETAQSKALWGLYRVLVDNMVTGVTLGYKKELEITGVGYKAELRGQNLVIVAGLSHPVLVKPIPGISLKTETPTKIVIEGIDKELVGRIAAEIRKVRPPEPYKGKGIKYTDEVIRRKAGKAAAKTTGAA
jgi:large subunit ribosomal protein L6